MDDYQYILSFWFGDSDDDAEVARQQSSLWWQKSEETDRLIWAKFEHRVAQAQNGELEGWLAEPQGRLACIILLDQFCRNIYRGKPEAFASDSLALAWCYEGLEQGMDRALRPIERVFFYLPLEHSENPEDQRRCIACFEALLTEAEERDRPVFADFLDFARRHQQVIERFGRYPHRNEILGRESTAEELAYLAQPGSGF